MRRYLSALAVALVALSGAARVWTASQNTLAVVVGYDLDSTSFVYPIALGPTSVPSTLIRPQAVEGWYTRPSGSSGATNNPRIKNASTPSASVVSCVTSSAAFSPVSTNDLIQVTDAFGRPAYAGIFDKTDSNTATLDRTLDLTQTGCASYRYRKVEAGAAITDGWFNVAGYSYVTVQVDIAQMVTSTSLGADFKLECAAANALSVATVLASSNITSTGSFGVAIPEPWDVCRVGMKITNTDDDSPASTDNEKISVYVIRRE